MIIASYRNTERGIRAKAKPEAAIEALPSAERVVRFRADIMPVNIAEPMYKRILREIAAEHGLPVSVMTGNRRIRSHVACRYEAIGRVWEECRDRDGNRLSLPRIGTIFAKDHTSILHALRKLGLIDS